MKDAIVCSNKEEADSMANEIGEEFVEGFDYFDDGKVSLRLTDTLKNIKAVKKERKANEEIEEEVEEEVEEE